MALFGNKKSLFGADPADLPARRPWDTPPIWGGDPIGDVAQQPMLQVGAAPSDYPITPGSPGTPQRSGINWWGVAADALAGAAGRPGPYAAMMRQRQDEASQIAAEQRRQAEQFAMWQQQKQWERANPVAPAPTEFERTVQAAGIQPGTPEYAQIMRQRAENQASAPPMVVTNPDGTKTVFPAGSIPRGPATMPTAPVGKLTPMGGAGSQGPGMFPLR